MSVPVRTERPRPLARLALSFASPPHPRRRAHLRSKQPAPKSEPPSCMGVSVPASQAGGPHTLPAAPWRPLRTPKDTGRRVQYSTGYQSKALPPRDPPSRPCALFSDCRLCISLHGRRRCPSHQSFPVYLGPYSVDGEGPLSGSEATAAAFTPQRLPASPAQMTLRDHRRLVGPIRLP